MRKNQNGFSVVELLIVLAIIGVLGFIGWKVVLSKKDSEKTVGNSTSQKSTASSQSEPDAFIWQQTAEGWQATEKAPNCPAQPMLKPPADISKATAVLYPGQTRGGNYKPHGGLRFDNSTDNAIKVISPVDGYMVRGGSYIAEGEIQYTFDVMNNCGVMYRVGHLRELPENLQKIADTWPDPSANSATQSINPAVFVKQGEVLGTKVGILGTNNTFFDFGVYDYRQQNEASKSAAYQSAQSQGKELAWHAVCWLKDWLPSKDTAALAKLPAGDPTSGKNSDYCK